LVEHAEAALRALGAHALEACVAAYATTTRDAVPRSAGRRDESVGAPRRADIYNPCGHPATDAGARSELSGRLWRCPRAGRFSADLRRPAAPRGRYALGQSCLY